jgi:hypothetical protein
MALAAWLLIGCGAKAPQSEPLAWEQRTHFYDGMLTIEALTGEACSDSHSTAPMPVWVALREEDERADRVSIYLQGAASAIYRVSLDRPQKRITKELPQSGASRELYDLRLSHNPQRFRLEAKLRGPLEGPLAQGCLYEHYRIEAKEGSQGVEAYPAYRYELATLRFESQQARMQAREHQPDAYRDFHEREAAFRRIEQAGGDRVGVLEELLEDSERLFGPESSIAHTLLHHLERALYERNDRGDRMRAIEMAQTLEDQMIDRFGPQSVSAKLYRTNRLEMILELGGVQ